MGWEAVNNRVPGYSTGNLGSTGKAARKRALYPTKKIMNDLGLQKGVRVKYNIEDKKLIAEPIKNPLELALTVKK